MQNSVAEPQSFKPEVPKAFNPQIWLQHFGNHEGGFSDGKHFGGVTGIKTPRRRCMILFLFTGRGIFVSGPVSDFNVGF